MTQSRDNGENASFAEAFEASLNFKQMERGDLLKGTIVSISGDDAFVSYGGPMEAVISTAEIEGKVVGDTVEATVVETGAQVRISRKMLQRRATIDHLLRAHENHLPVEGKVGSRNKGGFDVSVGGVRAFCPLSQITLGKIENPDSFVGQTLEFLVTEVSEDGRKLVVSRAALLKEEASARAEQIRGTLELGNVYGGKVKTIVPFGAFVDIGGIEGLLHVSEMSRKRVTNPADIVAVGQEVEVKVIKIEKDGKRLSFSMKDLEPDPWEYAWEKYQQGAQFTGTVVRKADFGLFVEVEPGLDGLVHLSQLPPGLTKDSADVEIGQTVTGWVREVDPERKRLSLALREVAVSDPWDEAARNYPLGKVVEGVVERGGQPGVFVSLEPGLTGLIPTSELAPGADPNTAHQPGEKLAVKIISIDPERRRIALSHEAAKAAGDRAEYMGVMKQMTKDAEAAGGKSAMALALERALSGKE
ncbi:MAG TPA: S1 RNA-binding domain-containing protein [Thermoanaerobaculia bacterium]|nr:S1 RNA-binding domain-containing protein [Thermoanaerobaculia bacterium]